MWANIFLRIFKTTFKPSLSVRSNNNLYGRRSWHGNAIIQQREGTISKYWYGNIFEMYYWKMKMYKTDIECYHWGIKARKISFTKNY